MVPCANGLNTAAITFIKCPVEFEKKTSCKRFDYLTETGSQGFPLLVLHAIKTFCSELVFSVVSLLVTAFCFR
jgi:hypothetical protein